MPEALQLNLLEHTWPHFLSCHELYQLKLHSVNFLERLSCITSHQRTLRSIWGSITALWTCTDRPVQEGPSMSCGMQSLCPALGSRTQNWRPCFGISTAWTFLRSDLFRFT